MSGSWSKSRIAFLAVGVICVVIGLVLIVPSLGG
jgi:hypothetical protein